MIERVWSYFAYDQPDYIYSNPQWDPWGKAPVFQRFNYREVYEPQIGLWKTGLKESKVLTRGVLLRWLP